MNVYSIEISCCFFAFFSIVCCCLIETKTNDQSSFPTRSISMTEWSRDDFHFAATKLVSILRKIDHRNKWSYDNECLVAVSTRDAKQIYEQDPQSLDVNSFDGDTIVLRSLCAVDWFVSISYSHIWRVPVLHFTVQTQNGMPLNRQDVFSLLNLHSSDPENANTSSDNVSIDEHPVTGLPAYFLHPCQTTDLLEQLQCTSGAPGSPESRLWSWMSMKLPSVGILIRPMTFCQIQSELERHEAKR